MYYRVGDRIRLRPPSKVWRGVCTSLKDFACIRGHGGEYYEPPNCDRFKFDDTRTELIPALED